MVIPVTPLRSAQADIRRAARFYENEAPGLGGEFIAEVERVLVLAVGHQRRHPDFWLDRA